jgi:hypothetical protein
LQNTHTVKNFIAFASIILFLVYACKQTPDKNHLSGDMVDNPLTADGKPDTSRMPKIIFDTVSHTFGTITEGQKVHYAFRFKNTGHAPLLISDASTSCGCTTPVKPDYAIQPGQTDSVVVGFDSAEHPGHFDKAVKIWSNTLPNTTLLMIHGDVKSNDKDK